MPPGPPSRQVAPTTSTSIFIAAGQVGPGGQVVGVDMTAEMLSKSRQTAKALGLGHVQFREGLAEALPAEAVDTFGGAKGQDKARVFDVFGYAFMARRPPEGPPGWTPILT